MERYEIRKDVYDDLLSVLQNGYELLKEAYAVKVTTQFGSKQNGTKKQRDYTLLSKEQYEEFIKKSTKNESSDENSKIEIFVHDKYSLVPLLKAPCIMYSYYKGFYKTDLNAWYWAKKQYLSNNYDCKDFKGRLIPVYAIENIYSALKGNYKENKIMFGINDEKSDNNVELIKISGNSDMMLKKLSKEKKSVYKVYGKSTIQTYPLFISTYDEKEDSMKKEPEYDYIAIVSFQYGKKKDAPTKLSFDVRKISYKKNPNENYDENDDGDGNSLADNERIINYVMNYFENNEFGKKLYNNFRNADGVFDIRKFVEA